MDKPLLSPDINGLHDPERFLILLKHDLSAAGVKQIISYLQDSRGGLWRPNAFALFIPQNTLADNIHLMVLESSDSSISDAHVKEWISTTATSDITSTLFLRLLVYIFSLYFSLH